MRASYWSWTPSACNKGPPRMSGRWSSAYIDTVQLFPALGQWSPTDPLEVILVGGNAAPRVMRIGYWARGRRSHWSTMTSR